MSPPPPLHYSGGHLDRAAALRRDDSWLDAMAAHPGAVVLPVWRDRSLVCSTGTGTDVRAGRCGLGALGVSGLLPRREPPPELEHGHAGGAVEWVFLGLEDGVPVFAVDLSPLDEEAALQLSGAAARGGAFVDLRRVGGGAPLDDAALMAYARGMMTWHRRQRFCGSCGASTRAAQGGHVRVCTSDSCGTHAFPRTDPAVIMLVERPARPGEPGRCLLARHARLPRGAHSTLAGFVEPGESLEEAVAREVMEETSVHVDGVSYRGSQPWPFPASLMVGFRARASTTRIRIDPEELEDARWFTAADLAGFGEWEDDGAEYRLPRRDSIARALLDEWLEEQRLAG